LPVKKARSFVFGDGEMALGDWDWVEAGGGRLARRDELMLKAQAMQALAMAKLSPRRADSVARIDLETILPPDGAVSRAAEALAAEVSEPWLFNHSARAYLWARLLLPDLRFDDEAVYVALMLHDLGLTQAFMDRSGEEVCFTRPAAREAHRLTRSMGWEERRARLVADAMQQRLGLSTDGCVVEVASNDGYLLQYVQQAGIPCYGIEPTASTAKAARVLGLEVIERFFGVALADELASAGRQADLIAANNVLAHVPDINDFVAGFAHLLKPTGVATFEFPQLLNLVRFATMLRPPLRFESWTRHWFLTRSDSWSSIASTTASLTVFTLTATRLMARCRGSPSPLKPR
jgi:SAM-dependent methyltransferase